MITQEEIDNAPIFSMIYDVSGVYLRIRTGWIEINDLGDIHTSVDGKLPPYFLEALSNRAELFTPKPPPIKIGDAVTLANIEQLKDSSTVKFPDSGTYAIYSKRDELFVFSDGSVLYVDNALEYKGNPPIITYIPGD